MARITGTLFDDDLVGTILNDTIQGLAGDDYLSGGAGNDTIEGGEGDDSLDGGNGNDILNGGNGNDVLNGKDGNNTLIGGNGTDSFYIGAGNNLVYGDDGDDFVYVDSLDAASSNLLDGGAGTDWISLSLFGTTQPITITFANGTFSLPGLTATNFENLFFTGGSGNDVVSGGSSYDNLNGGSGNDILAGEGGDDNLNGGGGNDRLLGGSGNDRLSIDINSTSNTFVSGGAGFDRIYLSAFEVSQGVNINFINNSITLPNSLTATGVETLTFYGSYYDDTVTGGNSDDYLWGNSGNDILSGGNGYDQIFGNDGDDVIDGGNGIDQLYGDNEFSSGNDILIGDLGADQMTGGGGADQFKFAAASGPGRFVAGRAILDFNQAEADKIILAKTMFPALQSVIGDGFSIPTEFATVQSATAAAASSALIVYNTRSGILYYNANGADGGFGDGGQFVTLFTKPSLTAADFVIQ